MRLPAILSTAVVIAMTACGSTSTGDPASAAMFVGTWTAQLGAAEVEMCGTQQSTTLLVGSFEISLTEPGGGEILTIAPNGCHLNWTANGNVATLAGQSCQVLGAEGGTWRATFTSGTLTLGTNEIALQDQGNGILTNDGATQSCTFTQSGSFKDN